MWQAETQPVTPEDYARSIRQKRPVNTERVAWILRHTQQAPGSAVDIGTKDGSLLAVLQARGWQAIGYDPDARFHGYADHGLGVTIRPELFSEATSAPASLDLVTACHTLEHVPDPLALLRTIRRALRPNGWLYIEVPNLRYIQRRQLIPGHLVLYSAQTLRQTVEAAGFTVRVVTEYAPGGLSSYDQLALLAQPGQPVIHWRPEPIARVSAWIAQRPFLHETPPARFFPLRVVRSVRRRIRQGLRRRQYVGP